MIEFRRILCPIDFSDHSRLALDHAMAIARWHKATVTVLHVFAPVPVAAVGTSPMILEAAILPPVDRDRLLADARAFADRESTPGATVETVIRGGSPAAEILEEAINMQADLLIIGTHGRSGFERLLLGSVAERVLRKANCPVMTVPNGQPDAVPAGPILYKSILCPVDFSESSLRALKYASAMAEGAQGRLTVVHVDEPEFETAAGLASVPYGAGTTIRDFLQDREQACQRRLEDVVKRTPAGRPVDCLLTRGRPWREVLRVAGERHSDLIVMGVQGRGVADLLFFGSTTQHVVREAKCPVLTLRREQTSRSAALRAS